MFTGFASENTPAIQVWDFFRPFATLSAPRDITLANDCAPIQFFKTGGANTNIIVQLPSSPIEGKTIKIVCNKYGTENQKITITTPDASGYGSYFPIWVIGPGQTIDLCYSKECISIGSALGSTYSTGWISLNQGSASSGNYSAINLGHNNVATSNYASSIGGAGNSATANYAGTFGGNNATSSGTRSSVVGGDTSTASGTNSAVVGGSNNTAGGQAAFVAGGASNTASSSNAAVVGGASNTVIGDNGSVLGGSSSSASGNRASVVGGQNNTASATNAAVVGGVLNLANQVNACVIGGGQGTTRLITGFYVTPASNVPIANLAGNQQLGTLLLGRQTTDATATVLRSDTNVASTTNQVILPNNSAYTFQGTCIANVTGGGATSGWKFEGVIKRGANAASTTLVAAVTPTIIAQDAGASTWVLAIAADTTNGGIAVTVTGQAATTIRWVAKIETTEVTF